MDDKTNVKKANDTDFSNRLAVAGADIFEDPMSDVTRSRQNSLLMTSFLTILVSLAIITPTNGSVVGINFALNSNIGFVLAVVTLYFLIVYLLSVYQDFKKYYYKQLLSWSALDDLYHKSVGTIPQILNSPEFDQKKSIISQKYVAKINELNERAGQFYENIDHKQLLKKGFLERILNESNYHEELSNKIAEKWTNELYKLLDQQQKDVEKQFERIKELLTIPKEYSRLSKIRLAIEIIFPVGLSLIAMWLSLSPK